MNKEKTIEVCNNFIEYFYKNIQDGNKADLTVLGEEIEAIQIVLNLVKSLQKDLSIVDEYASLLWGILYDYDGYYDPETKQGSLEGLASLVDEAMDYCDKIRNRDTTSIMYEDCNDNKYNILHEKIKGEENNG